MPPFVAPMSSLSAVVLEAWRRDGCRARRSTSRWSKDQPPSLSTAALPSGDRRPGGTLHRRAHACAVSWATQRHDPDGRVSRILPAKRAVLLSDGLRLIYDHLIVAAGATQSHFGNDAWAAHAPGLKTLADAFAIRRHAHPEPLRGVGSRCCRFAARQTTAILRPSAATTPWSTSKRRSARCASAASSPGFFGCSRTSIS